MEADEGKRFLSLAGCDDPVELDYYWDDVLRTADVDKNGKISKDEFLVYILGDEVLDSSGNFVDKARAAQLAGAVQSLRSADPETEPEPESKTLPPVGPPPESPLADGPTAPTVRTGPRRSVP